MSVGELDNERRNREIRSQTMQQKDSGGMNKTPQKPSTSISLLAKVMRIFKANKMVNMGGEIGRFQVFTRAPGRGAGFKQNQRMERKRSRIRKMKQSAR